MQRRVYHVRAAEQVDDAWRMLHEGGATVLLEREDAEDWIASVVICSPRDRFCKRTGLQIAQTRMRSHREGKDVRNVVNTCVTDARCAVFNAIQDVVGHYPRRGWKHDVRQWTIDHVLAPLCGAERKTAIA